MKFNPIARWLQNELMIDWSTEMEMSDKPFLEIPWRAQLKNMSILS